MEIVSIPKELLYREHRSTRLACYVLTVVCALTAFVNIGTSTVSRNQDKQRLDAMAQMWGIVLDGEGDPNDDLIKKLKHIYNTQVKLNARISPE